MKKVSAFLLFLIALFAISGLAAASDAAYRHATQVTDVTKPYEAEEWIISPDEEGQDDQTVGNVPECDMSGIIACNDADFLRVDILLNHGITYKWAVWYSLKLEYADMSEYFTYYSDTRELVYEKEKEGKIVETKVLTADNSADWAGITSSGETEDSDVYFIIKKTEHIGGAKGDKYFVTCRFMSGYFAADEKSEIGDETGAVDLEFIY